VTRYVIDAIRTVQKTHDAGNVYLMGHSLGVFQAYLVALQEPDLVKGVMAIAGGLREDLIPDERSAG
jgi:pimeloyl-ACP methyl ester carboxylesterase